MSKCDFQGVCTDCDLPSDATWTPRRLLWWITHNILFVCTIWVCLINVYKHTNKHIIKTVVLLMPLFVVLKSPRALSISPSLLRALSPSLCYPLTRTKSSVMASSNNVTPTNCSWWPISAMDEDGKITDGEESNESTIEHKPYSKDRLVLYHWTQSFSSQKVKNTTAWKWWSSGWMYS